MAQLAKATSVFQNVRSLLPTKTRRDVPESDGLFWYWGHPVDDGLVNEELSMWLSSDTNPRRKPGFISFERPTVIGYATKTIQAVLEHSADLELWGQAIDDKGEYFMQHLESTLFINSGHAAKLVVSLLQRIEELEGNNG